MEASEIFVYVGTYTHRGGEGIAIYTFDAATGTLKAVGFASSPNPSFLALDPQQRYLYAVNELWQPGGSVSAFAVDPETGALTLLNSQPSHGTSPCYVSVDATGRFRIGLIALAGIGLVLVIVMALLAIPSALLLRNPNRAGR